MRVGSHDFEVSTEPSHGGWRSVAFLPGGKQRSSMTCDSRESAEMDLYQKLKDEFAPVPKFDPNKRYEARAYRIMASLLDSEDVEPSPEDYLRKLPVRFDKQELFNRIMRECNALCMDNRRDKEAFMRWLEAHADLLPNADPAEAIATAFTNDSWCMGSANDIVAFIDDIDRYAI